MAVEFDNNEARFRDVVSVEDAEALLEWLQNKPSARIDLADCTHLHQANLQVLMAATPAISAWPRDKALASWLEAALPAR